MQAKLLDPTAFADSVKQLSEMPRQGSPLVAQVIDRISREAGEAKARGDEGGAAELEKQALAYQEQGISPREEALEYYRQAREGGRLFGEMPVKPEPIDVPEWEGEPGIGRTVGRVIRAGQEPFERAGRAVGEATQAGIEEYAPEWMNPEFEVLGMKGSPAKVAGALAGGAVEYAPSILATALIPGGGPAALAGNAGKLARLAHTIRSAGAIQRSVKMGKGLGAYGAVTEAAKQRTGEAPESLADVALAGAEAGAAGFGGQLLLGEALPGAVKGAWRGAVRPAARGVAEAARGAAGAIERAMGSAQPRAGRPPALHPDALRASEIPMPSPEMRYVPETDQWLSSEMFWEANRRAKGLAPHEPGGMPPRPPVSEVHPGSSQPAPELRYDAKTGTWTTPEEKLKLETETGTWAPAPPRRPAPMEVPPAGEPGAPAELGPLGPAEPLIPPKIGAAVPRPFPPEPVPGEPGTPTGLGPIGPAGEVPPPVTRPWFTRMQQRASGYPAALARALPEGMVPPAIPPERVFERPTEPRMEVPPSVTPAEALEGPSFGAGLDMPTAQALLRAQRYRKALPSGEFEPTGPPTFRPSPPLRPVTPAGAAEAARVIEPELPPTVPEAAPRATPAPAGEPPLPPELVGGGPPAFEGLPPPLPGHAPPKAPPKLKAVPKEAPREPGVAPPEEYPAAKQKLTFSQYFLTRKPEYSGAWDPKRAKADPDYEKILGEFRGEYLPAPKTKRQELEQAIADNEYIVQTGKNRLGVDLPTEAREQSKRWAAELRDRLSKLSVTEKTLGVEIKPAVTTRPKGHSLGKSIYDEAERMVLPGYRSAKASFRAAADEWMSKGHLWGPPEQPKAPRYPARVEWGNVLSPSGKRVQAAWTVVDLPEGQVVWDPQHAQWMTQEFFRHSRKPATEKIWSREQLNAFYEKTGEAPTPETVRGLTTSAKTAPAVVGAETEIGIAGEKTNYRARWEVVDIDAPIVSHDLNFNPNPAYLQALQGRGRERAASKKQVMELSQEGRFDPRQLGHSVTGDVGAPILGPDDMVDSHNGAMLVLRNIVGTKQMDEYQAWLMQRAGEFGIDPQSIQKVIRSGRIPVLIRRLLDDLPMSERAKRAAKWNVPPVASMSPSETAIADAAKMTPELVRQLRPTETGDPLESLSNTDFIRGFQDQVVPPAEAGTIMDARGLVSGQGLQRIRAALFSYTYGGKDPERVALLNRVLESTYDEIKNITTALKQAAPYFARLRADVSKKELWDAADLGNELARAAGIYLNIKRTPGASVENWLKVPDLLQPSSAAEKALVEIFHDNRKSANALTEVLKAYAQIAEAQGHPGQQSMFGAGGKPDKVNMLRSAVQVAAKGYEGDIPGANEVVGSDKLVTDSVARLEADAAARRAGGQFASADLVEAEANLYKPQRKGRKRGKTITKVEPKGGAIVSPKTVDDLKAIMLTLQQEAGLKKDPSVIERISTDIPRLLWKIASPEFLTRRGEHQAWYNVFRLYQKAADSATRLRRMFLNQTVKPPFWARTPEPTGELATAWSKFSTKLANPDEWVVRHGKSMSEKAAVALNRDTVLDALRGRISREQLQREVGAPGVAVYDQFRRLPGKRREGVLRTMMRPDTPEGFIPVWRKVPWKKRDKVVEALIQADTAEHLAERSHTTAELRKLGLSDAGLVAYRRTQEILHQILTTVINPLRKKLGLEPLEGRKNYLPHKWLGNWELKEAKLVNGEWVAQERRIMTEDGMTFDTEHAAFVAAHKLLKSNPNAKFMVVPSFFQRAVMEELPDTVEARMLSVLTKRLAKTREVSSEELAEIVKKGVGPRGFPAHLERRYESKGWNKREMLDVIQNYIGQASSYAPMRQAREAARLLMEGEELIKLRNDQPEVAAALDRYITSLHGGQSEAERIVDGLLKRVPVLKSYLGIRPSREIGSGVRQAVTQIKLGLLSTSYMLVNATQFITHTTPWLGPEYAARGAQMYFRALLHPEGPEGRLLHHLSKRGLIEPMFLGGEMPTHGLQAKRSEAAGKLLDFGSWLKDQAMLGTRAEHFNRGATLLGSYARLVERGFTSPMETRVPVGPKTKAVLEGLDARLRSMGLTPGKKVGNDKLALLASDLKQSEWDWVRATPDGNKISHDVIQNLIEAVNRKVNFDYGRGSRPEWLRGPFVELVGQFKMFSVGTMQMWKQAADYARHTEGLQGYGPIAGHLGTVLTLAGLFGFPFFNFMDASIRALAGDEHSPMDWLLQQGIPQPVLRGSPALLSVDASRRAGYGDILPQSLRELMTGPAVDTLLKVLSDVSSLDFDMAMRETAPGPGNVYAAWRNWRGEGVRERGRAGRMAYIPSASEIVARGVGFRPMLETRLADEIRIERRKEKDLKWNRARAIDEAIRIIKEYEGSERDELLVAHARDAVKDEVYFTPDDVKTEMEKQQVPQIMRQVKRVPKALRGAFVERAGPLLEEQQRRLEALQRAVRR